MKRRARRMNPDMPLVPLGRTGDNLPAIPVAIMPRHEWRPPRVSFDLMLSGQAPFAYLPEGAYEHPPLTTALGSLLTRRGIADVNAWEDLLAQCGSTRAKLYVVDRSGERYQVMDVEFDYGGDTGQLVVRHLGSRSRGGDLRVDIHQAFGRMLPVVVYSPSQRNSPDVDLRRIEREFAAGVPDALSRLDVARARAGTPFSPPVLWRPIIEVPRSWLQWLGPSRRTGGSIDDLAEHITRWSDEVVVRAVLVRGFDETYVRLEVDGGHDGFPEWEWRLADSDVRDDAVIQLKPDELRKCDCHDGHASVDEVCKWCWQHGRRRWSDPDIDDHRSDGCPMCSLPVRLHLVDGGETPRLPRTRRNSDEDLRALERKADAGDREAFLAFLRGRERTGQPIAIDLMSAVEFFYDNDLSDPLPGTGRATHAIALAEAEVERKRRGWQVYLSRDDYINSQRKRAETMYGMQPNEIAVEVDLVDPMPLGLHSDGGAILDTATAFIDEDDFDEEPEDLDFSPDVRVASAYMALKALKAGQ